MAHREKRVAQKPGSLREEGQGRGHGTKAQEVEHTLNRDEKSHPEEWTHDNLYGSGTPELQWGV